ncbi:MAG: helix-turn-helix domain-containing protein [Rhodobacteraceae bacterium]|nr:helix-turn-helix domain-containing protein [Paracoccaceae bacterium]
MAQTVPLIRTAALVPWVRWLRENGRPVTQRLEAAGLAFLDLEEPNAPAPLLLLLDFIRQQADTEGMDIGCRVVTETSVVELANLGLVALTAETLYDAFTRVSRHMPRHCSHEVLTVEEHADWVTVCEFWHFDFDATTLHLIEQYVAALLHSICRLARPPGPCGITYSLVPHPEAGLAHLRPWLGDRLEASSVPRLALQVPSAAAHARLPVFELSESEKISLTTDWAKLRERGILADSLEVTIMSMLPEARITADLLAKCAGMTTRTLQRRLEDEDTSVSDLIDTTRRRIALERLEAGDSNLSELAAALGYTNPSAFTRAVRRWTGQSPRTFRMTGQHAASPRPRHGTAAESATDSLG